MLVHKSRIITLLLVACMLVLGACAAPPPVPPAAPTSVPTLVSPTGGPPTIAPTTVPNSNAPAGLSVTDGAGRKVEFTASPSRIISLAPSATEIVFALGAGDKVIGADQFSDYPAAAKEVPRVSDGFNPNYEQILAAKPDLVLAAGITSPDALKKLEELGLKVLVVGSEQTTFENVMNDIELVGQVLGAPDKAQSVIEGMKSKIADVRARVAKATIKPRVFWELDATDPAKPYTAGPGSFVHELIGLAGGESVGGNLKSPYAQVSAEEVIQQNPEIIIMSDAAYGVAPESVGKRPGWDVIAAVKNNKVFPIDDNLVSRPGPRLAEGLEAAAKLIHPEVFQ